MPSITGGIVVVGSRILMPVDLATVRTGFSMPIVGTVSVVGTIGTIEAVLEVGMVERVITVATVGTIASGRVTASVSSGIVNRVDTVSTVTTVTNVGTIVEGKITASVSSGAVDRVGSLSGGVLDHVRHVGTIGTIRHVGTVAVIGSLMTSGTLPVVVRGRVDYSTILALLSPSTVSGTFTSPSVDALYYPGGVGFSIAYIGGEPAISATVLIQNSMDNTLFRTVGTITIPPGSQHDSRHIPTRRYWRFIAINYSTLESTIDAAISLLPSGVA